MKQRILLTIGLIFVAAGLFLGYRPFMHWLHGINPVVKPGTHTSFKVEPGATKEEKLITGKPIKIEVPSVGIALPVIDGFFNSKDSSWTLSWDKAHYAAVTPMPNNKQGKTFIYAHNRKDVFYTLPKVELGAKAIVTTDNKHKFVYKLSSVETTKPNDTSLFNYKGAPVLTLQTCTGAWYQNRTLFTFQLVEVA